MSSIHENVVHQIEIGMVLNTNSKHTCYTVPFTKGNHSNTFEILNNSLDNFNNFKKK